MAFIDRDRWQILEPLLDHALELSAEARANWLAEMHTTSPELATELRQLLSAESLADRNSFLTEPLDFALPELAGMQLGAYTLERPIGDGGMGSVWLARRSDGRFEGAAAVKLLNLSLLSERGKERFRREGTLLAKLSHAGIARLFDAGVAATGQPYLVLELVDGQTIDVYVEEHHLSQHARIRLFLQVLAAVGHAHANLIVHRDIKPSNILVRDDGTVKLLDFGIAKLLDDDERSAITVDGGRLLTPGFAAPEQVRGETITTATDVYSLGALLYLLLSGRHPGAVPARLRLGDLDTVLLKALKDDPRERYASVAAFAYDLERYLRNEPVTVKADSFVYRARKFVRRNRAAVVAAAAMIVMLLGATGFSVSQRRAAVLQRDAALRDAMRTRAMVEMQAVIAGDTRGPDGELLTSSQRVALAERILARQFEDQPWLVAEVSADLSNRLYESGDVEGQRQLLARARDIADRNNELAPAALTRCLRAASFWYVDQLDSARIELAAAKRILGNLGENADSHVRRACLEAEGKMLVESGDADAGIAMMRAALALIPADAPETSRPAALNALAEVMRLAGRQREAIPLQREVIATLAAAGYAETEIFPNALTFLTGSLWEVGEYAAVDSLLEPIVREREASNGSGRIPGVLAFLYGQAKLRVGDLDEAELWLMRAQRDTTQGAGGLARWMPAAMTELRLDQGRITEAQEEAAQLSTASRGRRATTAMLRARIRAATGDADGAIAMLESELRALDSDGERTLALFALPHVTAGEIRLAAGDAEGALAHARAAYAAGAVDSVATTNSVFAGRAELLRAQALLQLRKSAEARVAADRAVVALRNGYGASNTWARAARELADSLN